MAKSKKWIWYFLVLACLGSLAVVIPILYNLSMQLTPEKLARAQAQWQQNPLDDYQLQYSIKVDANKQMDRYRIVIEEGQVTSAHCNGKSISLTDPLVWTIPELFQLIEDGLQKDQQTGQSKNYAIAYFEKKYGYPMRYIRRERGNRSRLEINVKLLTGEQQSEY